MIVIEDRFADVVITDEDVDQIQVVGDLIRHIENVDYERRRRTIVEARRSCDPQVIRATLSWPAAEPAEQQDRSEQVGMRKRPATYVEGAAFFHARIGVIDGRGGRRREHGDSQSSASPEPRSTEGACTDEARRIWPRC